MVNKYRHIGQVAARKDALDIVTGKTKYVDDIRFPKDMLHAKVLRSPHAHAIIKKIDKKKAEQLKGVEAVLTWEDVPDWRGGIPPICRILDKKVRYVGDAVAIVAATTEEIADEALKLIDVEYEVLPAVYDVEEALKPDAPQLFDELPGNVVPPEAPIFLGPNGLTKIVMGDVDEGFAEADVITEGTFSYEGTPNPIPAELPGAVVLWEEPNKVTIWAISQHPYNDGLFFKGGTNGEVDARVLGNPCGGGFGSRGMSWHLQMYAALLSRATGKRVKIMYTREEHLAAFSVRLGSRMKAKVGMKKDGTITALRARWFVDTGYYSTFTQFMVAVGCGEAQIITKCRNWDLRPVIVCTNRNASCAVRGFGGLELKSALTPLLCLAMAKADLDPVEFFKKNIVQPGEGYFWRDGKWYVFRGVDYTKAMDKGAEKFGWQEKWKGWLKPTSVSGTKRIGVGVGVHGNADVGEDVSETYVRLLSNGTAVINSSVIEHGTGQRSNYMKMVAEVLQLPLDAVSMSPSDSEFNPYEFGPAGSRGTFAIGSAMINAAEDARNKLLEIAAPVLGEKLEDLDTVDGFIFVKHNPDKRIPWIAATGFDRVITGLGRFEPDYSLCNFMMTYVEVEVDTETGKVTILRVLNATDVGTVIDPQGLRGQLNGCFSAAGIDTAIFEETIMDRNLGRMMNPNMIDYKWRTFSELPEMEHVILETPFPSHRFGAVGVGEIAPAPGPSAVLMAVSNAMGAWIHDYPITPDKVLSVWETLTKEVSQS
ncbi:xanthine dehydrogenase family protein molybdopterin-binding subunit [Desulfosporosinus burensis]